MQCFAIYMGVICSRHPDRLPDLLGYLCQICRASERYRWPSWVVFDQNFRQLVADQGLPSLARLDSTLFTQCFNGQNKEGQAWCQYCHSLDHCSNGCPQRPRPPKSIKLAEPKPKPTTSIIAEICNNYNSKRGCKFDKFCRRLHKCSGCGGAHSRSGCPSSTQVQQGPSGTHPPRSQ